MDSGIYLYSLLTFQRAMYFLVKSFFYKNQENSIGCEFAFPNAQHVYGAFDVYGFFYCSSGSFIQDKLINVVIMLNAPRQCRFSVLNIIVIQL